MNLKKGAKTQRNSRKQNSLNPKVAFLISTFKDYEFWTLLHFNKLVCISLRQALNLRYSNTQQYMCAIQGTSVKPAQSRGTCSDSVRQTNAIKKKRQHTGGFCLRDFPFLLYIHCGFTRLYDCKHENCKSIQFTWIQRCLGILLRTLPSVPVTRWEQPADMQLRRLYSANRTTDA